MKCPGIFSSTIFHYSNFQPPDFSILDHCIFARRLRVWRRLPTFYPDKILAMTPAWTFGDTHVGDGCRATHFHPLDLLGPVSKSCSIKSWWRKVVWSPCRPTSLASSTRWNGKFITFMSLAWPWTLWRATRRNLYWKSSTVWADGKCCAASTFTLSMPIACSRGCMPSTLSTLSSKSTSTRMHTRATKTSFTSCLTAWACPIGQTFNQLKRKKWRKAPSSKISRPPDKNNFCVCFR